MWNTGEINDSVATSYKVDGWAKSAAPKSTWETAAAGVVNSGWPTGVQAQSEEWNPLARANSDVANGARWPSQGSNEPTQAPVAIKPASSSWSEVARKNVPAPCATVVATTPSNQANAFKASSAARRANAASDWGKPVDQGTPWDVGGFEAKSCSAAVTPSPVGITPASSWSTPSRNAESSWSTNSGVSKVANARNTIGDVAYWKTPYEKEPWSASAPGGPSAGPTAVAMVNSGSWDDQQVAPSTSSRPTAAWMAQESVQSNVWTGPPVQPDSSMVWNNPYPKKSAALDKGTSIWGDPEIQGEIRRWKSSADEQAPTQHSATAAAVGGGGAVQQQQPVEVADAAPSPIQQLTSQQQQQSTGTPSSSVWKDSPMAPRPSKSVGMTPPGPGAGNSNAWANAGGYGRVGLIDSFDNGATWNNSGDAAGASQPSSVLPSAIWSDSTAQCASKTSSRHDSADHHRQSVDSSSDAPPPSEDVFTCQSTFGKAVLANQVAEQLSAAVKTGLIESHVLSQPLPPDTLYKLNQLLHCVTKLEQAESELNHLHSLSQKGPLNGAQQHEYQRITGELTRLREKAHLLKTQINSQTAPAPGTIRNKARNEALQSATPSSNSNSAAYSQPTGGDSLNGSKLLQWKHSSERTIQEKSAQNGDRRTSYEVSSSSDAWSAKRVQHTYDWPPQAQGMGTFAGSSDDAKSSGTASSSDNNVQQGGGSAALQADDGPPEFRPGQKWEWRDPREMAEDPNATPGSIKTSAISLTRLTLDSKLHASATSQHGVMYSSGVSATSKAYDSKFMQISSVNSSSNVFNNDGWSGKNVRSPLPSPAAAAAAMPFMGRMPPRMVSSTSTYGGNAPQYMQPAPVAAQQQQWVVILNANMVDEQTLQFLVSRVGSVQAFVLPPGSGFAAVKYKEVSADKAIVRLQQDCSSVGLTAYVAKDAEVEKLIHSSSAQRQSMFQPGGPPMGPPHGVVWDAPPPGGSWAPGGAHQYGPPPGVPLPDHVAFMSHAPGAAPIYGDSYYGGMDRHSAY